MKNRKRWLGYLGASALALLIALLCVSLEVEDGKNDSCSASGRMGISRK